jgi:hypothetical protein
MTGRAALALVGILALLSPVHAGAAEIDDLVAALQGPTPFEEDLRVLTDEIGGRMTGSEANQRSVEWALERFREAGVDARAEAFTMPELWLESSTRVAVEGDVAFPARAVAMPFTPPTPSSGLAGALLDGGSGSEADFDRLGGRLRDAFVLVETPLLEDLDGLFREYADATSIVARATAGRAAGVVTMASRPANVLYRHLPPDGPANTLTQVILEREAAERALRLVRAGRQLRLRVAVDAETGGSYESHNVIGEIRGSELPEEIVLLGAHLDSWDLGTGALDNGCNVVLLIDVARQMRRLGLTPRRTIRFVLWNGEEQGMLGSKAYVKAHADELDNHVMASSFDLGSGRITGFFTNGREELIAAVDRALEPVARLGSFTQVNEPIVGTDNYDFMLEGVANLVAVQEAANYGPHYHARNDTFDEVDLEQMRKNAAIAAALAWGFAQGEVTWGRQTPAEVEALVEGTSLGAQMQAMGFGLWEQWTKGERGRRP